MDRVQNTQISHEHSVGDLTHAMMRIFSSNFADEIDNGGYECVCGSCEDKVSDVELDYETRNIVMTWPMCVYSQIITSAFTSEKSIRKWKSILDLYYEDRKEYEKDLEEDDDEVMEV